LKIRVAGLADDLPQHRNSARLFLLYGGEGHDEGERQNTLQSGPRFSTFPIMAGIERACQQDEQLETSHGSA
jgi:hypothetical protein